MSVNEICVAWPYMDAITAGDATAREDLAQYVLEGLPEISAITSQAEETLRDLTGDASFDGYVSLDRHPDRLEKQVQAIFLTLQQWKPKSTPGAQLKYQPGIPTAVLGTQPLRLAPTVLSWGEGNCLEWSLVMAACLYNRAIYPLILVTREPHHALLGYWKCETAALGNNKTVLAPEEVPRDQVLVLDATCIPPSASGRLLNFDEARKEGEKFLPPGDPSHNLAFAVDVRTARVNRIFPVKYEPNIVWNELPRRPHIIGRQRELRELMMCLFSRAHPIEVWGLPGSGKSALVAEAVHWLVHESLQFTVLMSKLEPPA